MQHIKVKTLQGINWGNYSSYCKKNGFSLTLDTSMTPKLNGGKQPLQYKQRNEREENIDKNVER